MTRHLPRLSVLAAFLAASLPASAEREEEIRRNFASILVGSEEAKSQIARLNNEEFSVREDASRKLMQMRPFPLQSLREATASSDPETRFRVREILATMGVNGKLAIKQQLALIIEFGAKGLSKELMQAMAGVSEASMMMQGAEAAAITALPKEEAILLDGLNHADPAVRVMALAGMGSLSRDRRTLFRKLLNDPHEWVRLRAALLLANLGERSCLPVLAELVASKCQLVSEEAGDTLVLLTGRKIVVKDIASLTSRSAASLEWKQWIRDSSPSSELRFPLPAFRSRMNLALVFHDNYNARDIVELDRNDRRRRDNLSLVVLAPWSLQRLKSGNFLVGFMDVRNFRAIEFDPKGKMVWSSGPLGGGVISVQRLANGNTVAALSDAKKVVEIDGKGKVVWSVDTRTRATDAVRLMNGNTLISEHVFPGKDLSGRVFEVDPSGKEVWSINNVKDPQKVQRLPNGDTLVAQSRINRVAAYNPKGKMVWSFEGELKIPIDVHRLDDGTVLVIDSEGIHRISQKIGLMKFTPMPGLARGFPY